jgi:hypothetical protein
MISTRKLGRWIALGAVLAMCSGFSQPASAQKKKKGGAVSAAAKGAGKGKKKPQKAEPEPEADAEPEEAKAKPEPKGKQKAAAKKKGKKEKAAPADEHKIVVLPFEGPNGKKLHGYVSAALKDTEGVSDVSDGASARENSADAAVAIAKQENASAVVYGTASKKRAQVVLELMVRNGADGEVIAEPTLKAATLPKLKKKIDTELGIELADSIAESKAPAAEPEPEPEPAEAPKADAEEEEEPEPAEEAEEKAEEPEEAAAPGKRPSPFELMFGVRPFNRKFSYSDDLHEFDPGTPEQSTYSGPGVALFLQLRWYPIAHKEAGTLSNLGLTGGYERGFLTKAKPPSGGELDVTTQEFFFGLRGRFPVGAHELGLSGTYGQHEFTVQDDEVLLPDVRYSYLRPALDGRFRLKRIVLGFSLGYRLILSAGQVQDDDWFPNASVGGIDVGLFGGYAVSKHFDLLAGVDMRRYFYSMNPEPGDARVAGGAVDQFLSGWVGVSWRLPGDDK